MDGRKQQKDLGLKFQPYTIKNQNLGLDDLQTLFRQWNKGCRNRQCLLEWIRRVRQPLFKEKY